MLPIAAIRAAQHAATSRTPEQCSSSPTEETNTILYALSSFRLRVRVLFMSFLYLCFFIFSLRCLFTLISRICGTFLRPGALRTVRSALGSRIVCLSDAVRYCELRCEVRNRWM